MQTKISTWLSSVLFVAVAQTGFAYDFYVGGTVGIGALDAEFKHHNETTGSRYFSEIGSTSFIGGGLIGVENVYCDCLYTALEFNVRYDSLNDKVFRATDAYQVKLKNDFQYGLDLKLGTPIDFDCGCSCFQTTPYFLVGIEAGEWKTHIHNDTSSTFGGILANSSLNHKETRAAPKIGFGVRWNWWSCVTVDFQYNFAWYGKIHRSSIDDVPNEWHHRFDLDQHNVLLSFSVPLDGLFGSWFGGSDCCGARW